MIRGFFLKLISLLGGVLEARQSVPFSFCQSSEFLVESLKGSLPWLAAGLLLTGNMRFKVMVEVDVGGVPVVKTTGGGVDCCTVSGLP